MAAVDRLVDELEGAVELGGGLAPGARRVARGSKIEMAADLAQAQQRGEHRDAIAAGALLARVLEDLAPALREHGAVDLALLVGELAERGMLELGRQLGQHFLLRAAQEERPHALAQARQRLAARVVAGERRLVALAEIGRGAEIAGQEKIEERPEIEHRIFQRRAGEDEPVPRAKHLRALRVLAAAILDVLRLVQRDEAEVPRACGAARCRAAGSRRR